MLDDLQQISGLGPTASFNSLSRHLHWLLRYHGEGKPEGYASDISDLRERDLPGVVASIEAWAGRLLDLGLLQSISPSWEAGHYGSAVRDAFIYLEDVCRDVGGIDPARGLSGDRLVTSLIAPSSRTSLRLPDDGFMGELTGGEREGAYNLLKAHFFCSGTQLPIDRSLTQHQKLRTSFTW
ncbi:MAG: hypothetical protein ACRDX8_03930 [Acidimicrobiales bacterium]